MKERPQLGRREIVGVKFTSQKNVCPMRGKNASWHSFQEAFFSVRHFVQEAFFPPDSVCPTFFGNVLGEEVSSERVH